MYNTHPVTHHEPRTTHRTQHLNGSTPRLVNQLIAALNHAEIAYCHWKSNIELTAALAGELDLDLLVAREDLGQMQTVLHSLGFKEGHIRGGSPTPSVYHYYGLDPKLEPLVHVHLFSDVVTGESYVKSHHLPLTEMLLSDIRHVGALKVTGFSAELVIFILRHFIKYGSLIDLWRIRNDSAEIREELHWLLNGSDLGTAHQYLSTYCPVVSAEHFNQCITALDENTPLWQRYRLARTMRHQLHGYARHNRWSRWLAYVSFFGERFQRKWRGYRRNKTLDAGGAVVAFVGPEATGKSTLVADSKQWLGSVFATQTIHVGKPPSTWLTKPFNIIVPLARRLLPSTRPTRIENKRIMEQKSTPKGAKGILYATRAVITAYDRRQLLRKAHKAALNGDIVICDRYPAEQVGAMDSPRLVAIDKPNSASERIFNRLVAWEQKLYRQMPPPDVALRLTVSLETALQRNRDRQKVNPESDAYVTARHKLNRGWRRGGTKHVADVSTEQSLEATVQAVRQTLWEAL